MGSIVIPGGTTYYRRSSGMDLSRKSVQKVNRADKNYVHCARVTCTYVSKSSLDFSLKNTSYKLKNLQAFAKSIAYQYVINIYCRYPIDDRCLKTNCYYGLDVWTVKIYIIVEIPRPELPCSHLSFFYQNTKIKSDKVQNLSSMENKWDQFQFLLLLLLKQCKVMVILVRNKGHKKA